MSDIMEYHTLATDADDIKLSVLKDTETGKYFMPSLEFINVKDREYPDQTLFWDNEDYIFGPFKEFLKHCKKRQSKGKHIKHRYYEEYQDIWHILTPENVNQLWDMIELAEKYGWYVKKEEEVSNG